VTAAHYEVFFARPNSFLAIILPTPETLSILFCVRSRYIASGRPPQKTPFPNNSSVVIEVCLPRRCIETEVIRLLLAYSLPRDVFTEQLPSDGRLPATHILCNCEAVAHVRVRHLGQFFMEPIDYYDAPIYKVLHFIRGVGLIKG
jgi:hypothetical protein